MRKYAGVRLYLNFFKYFLIIFPADQGTCFADNFINNKALDKARDKVLDKVGDKANDNNNDNANDKTNDIKNNLIIYSSNSLSISKALAFNLQYFR